MSTYDPPRAAGFPTASACTRILIDVIAASGAQETAKTLRRAPVADEAPPEQPVSGDLPL
jgi:hypothetical protein